MKIGRLSALALAGVLMMGTAAMAGDVQKFELEDLADGETRELGDGERQVTATRNGDVVTLNVQGEEGKAKTITVDLGDGGGGKVMMIEGDGHSKFVMRAHDGHNVHKDVRVFTSNEADDAHNVFVLDGLGEGMSWFAEEGADMLRCPEGDVTMTLEKDDAGSYYCPKHNVELERVKGNTFHHRTVVIEDADED